jgi:threonine dehydratase
MKVSLADVQEAQKRLKPVVRLTNVGTSTALSQKLGKEVYFKFENNQHTGSFKLRGAYNKISCLTPDERKRGVIACSAGNHAQGVAFSATKAGVKSKVVMPIPAPIAKVEATRDYGAEVLQYGEIYDEAYEKARELEKLEGMTFVHPFEDPLVIAGQGTIGLELLQQISDLDSVVIPIGGGGLISGVATAIKALRPQCRVIGVQSANAPGMSQLFHHQAVQNRTMIATIADGIAVKKPSQVMYESFISKLVDDIVTVTDDEIAEAIVLLLERSKTLTEGSGAAGVAAMMFRNLNLGQRTCALLCGGNIDLNTSAKIIERGQIRKGRLVGLSVVVEDLPGSLNRLTRVIAEQRANVLEVHHDRVHSGLGLRETRIDFLLETKNHEHIQGLKAVLMGAGCRLIET